MGYNSQLSQHRLSIDLLDRALLDILAERCRLVRQTPDLSKRRNTLWEGMGHFAEGLGRGISLEFLIELGKILDQDIDLENPSAIEAVDEVDLLGSLDVLDKTLILILSERFKVVRRIGVIKRKHDQAPLDPRRWQNLLEERLMKAEVLGVPQIQTKSLFELIHQFALDLENQKQD